MSILYSSKTNERLIAQAIISEPHTIGIIGVAVASPGLIRLVEVPQSPSPLSTVSIPGYTEIAVGSPTGTQFLVDYTTGVITFNVSQDGNAILVSYNGLGSEIAAEDINELQDPVGVALNLNGSLSNNIVKPASISNTGTDDFIFPRDVSITREAKAIDFITASASPASTGVLRLAHTDVIAWKNFAGSGDDVLASDGSDDLTWKGNIIATGAGAVTSVQGTANEVLVNATSGSPQTGALILTTPQAIDSTATPTFSSETLVATTNQLVLGVTNTTTITSPAPSASRVVTLPDVGTDSSFILSESSQSITNITPATDALVINNTTPSQGLLVNGKVQGFRDNGSCMTVAGHQDPAEGVAVAQSYSGVFNQGSPTAYDVIGKLKTRYIIGSNSLMDLQLQTDNWLLLSSGPNDGSGHIRLGTDGNVAINARSFSETDAVNQLLLDRVDTSSLGNANTSDCNINVSSGNLALMAGNTTGAVILPTLTTTQQNALTPVAGMTIFNSSTNQFVGYNGSSWVILG